MPTYDYVCRACGHRFELYQTMSEGTKRKCPDCGRLKLERLIGAGAGVIFKGSGFYETDYRSESYREAAKAESGGGDKSEGSPKPKSGETAGAKADSKKKKKPASD